MAPLLNGYPNGASRHLPNDPSIVALRFSDIPAQIDIPVTGLEAEEAVEVNLEELLDDPTELCTLLEQEGVGKHYWMVIALAYAKQAKVDHAIEILSKGLGTLNRGNPKEKLGPLSLTCWLYLWKSREAPRVLPDGQPVSETRLKDFYLQAATGCLNEASRINPAFPPLFLAKGVLYLLRASLQPPSKAAAPGVPDISDRGETLRQSIKCFEDALRVSAGRNMMATLGRARAYFSLGKYAEALDGYQEVLLKMPHLQDPDPRIGIGCCLWQLGHKEEAREAWERALDLNAESKIANILLGLYYIHDSSHYATTDPSFGPIYKKAMTVYTQKAFKLDKELPLTCATFGSYFMMRKSWATVDNLARKAIEHTDVNAVASDGWYLLARKEHYQDRPDLTKANDFYQKADLARGGGDKGYLPARFGLVQIQILQRDYDGAKFRLEKIIQQSKSTEAMMILGALHAEDVFRSQASGIKEDKSAEVKKATTLLEAVRLAWKDPQKKLTPDTSVLVYLARLYETDHPDKALQCLQQVEQMTINDMPNKDPPDGTDADEAWIAKLREQLSPQLLCDIGCFHFNAERFDQAREFFQTALNSCVKAGEKDEGTDTDALVTTISYNLARTYEAAGLLDEARQVYEGLLARHEDYTDARTRLAYIELRQNPTEDGPKAMAALYETDSMNLEVRSLFGWYLSKAKRRAPNIAEDQEQRHYKHTLQHHDKHDRYSLTGMGNLYLATAREMRRDTDQDKEKRRKTYEKAVEFYDKALQLDPRNAYAAQGIAIALVEDRKDLTAAVQLFSKIRDTVKDPSVYVNLGHVFAELKQYSRSIESYEAALTHNRGSDPQILACLGRVWLLKGKHDKSPSAMKTALSYSHRALALAPQQIHFQFNIAFVQIQLAQLIHILPESQRTLEDVVKASEGLEEAIESFGEIAQSKNPPYPRHDIEQRANMGRNTMRRQLERAVQSQTEYEEKNAAKLQEARELRDAEIRRREEEKRKVEEQKEAERQKIREERDKMAQLSRELAEKRTEEERRREEAEYTTDEEGERVKRTKKKKGGKRKKKGEDSDTGTEAGDGADDKAIKKTRKKKKAQSTEPSSAMGSSNEEGGATKIKKKRKRLARRAGKEDKFKSQEMVVDSDSEDDRQAAAQLTNGQASNDEDGDTEMRDAEEQQTVTRQKPRNRVIDDDDEDEDEDEEEDEENEEPSNQTTAEMEAEEDGGHKGASFADNPHGDPVDESVGAAGDAGAKELAMSGAPTVIS
ncbi:protein required for normal CLN1 and CLN2 G1 cyclin expression [Xanthoria calcicola]